MRWQWGSVEAAQLDQGPSAGKIMFQISSDHVERFKWTTAENTAGSSSTGKAHLNSFHSTVHGKIIHVGACSLGVSPAVVLIFAHHWECTFHFKGTAAMARLPRESVEPPPLEFFNTYVQKLQLTCLVLAVLPLQEVVWNRRPLDVPSKHLWDSIILNYLPAGNH